MLMMPQKKKVSSLIVSKLSGGDGKLDFIDRGSIEDEESSEPSYSAEEAAMSTFLRAMKREDAKGMAAALKDFIYLCEDCEDESEEDLFSRE